MSPIHRNILMAGCLTALAFILAAMLAGKPSGSDELAQRRLGSGIRAARNEEGRPGGLLAPRLTLEERQQRRAETLGRAENAENADVADDDDTPVPPRRLFMSQRERQERQEALRQRMLNQQAGTPTPATEPQPGSGTVRRVAPDRTPPQRKPRNPNIPIPPQDSEPVVISRSILDSPQAAPAKDEKNIREMSSDEIMMLMGDGE